MSPDRRRPFRPWKSPLCSQMVYRSEQGLRGVVVLTVTGADNTRGRILRDDVGSAGVLVAHDDAVDLIGVEGLDGVDEALALDRGGRGAAKVEAVGRKDASRRARRSCGCASRAR